MFWGILKFSVVPLNGLHETLDITLKVSFWNFARIEMSVDFVWMWDFAGNVKFRSSAITIASLLHLQDSLVEQIVHAENGPWMILPTKKQWFGLIVAYMIIGSSECWRRLTFSLRHNVVVYCIHVTAIENAEVKTLTFQTNHACFRPNDVNILSSPSVVWCWNIIIDHSLQTIAWYVAC